MGRQWMGTKDFVFSFHLKSIPVFLSEAKRDVSEGKNLKSCEQMPSWDDKVTRYMGEILKACVLKRRTVGQKKECGENLHPKSYA